MAAQQRSINMDYLFRTQRAPRIEFWRKNEDGTCTRLVDGLTIPAEEYDRKLPPRRMN